MILFSILSALSAASSATALAPRAACSTLGAGWTDTASAFTLEGYFPSTATVVPLYLKNVHTVPKTSYHVITPRYNTSSPTPGPFATSTLVNGIIRPFAPSAPFWTTVSIGTAKIDGTSVPYQPPGPWPAFATNPPSSPPAQTWCAVPNLSGVNQLLALQGRTDLFAVCTSAFPGPGGTIPAVVYDPLSSATITGLGTYDGSSCQAVVLRIVQ